MEIKNQAQNNGNDEYLDSLSPNRSPKKTQKNDRTMAKKNKNSDLAGKMVSPETNHAQTNLYVRFIKREIKKYTEEEFVAIGDKSNKRVLKRKTDYFYKTVMLLDNINGMIQPGIFDVRNALKDIIESGEHERTLEFIMNIQYTNKSQLGEMAELPNTWKTNVCDCIWDLKEDNYFVVPGKPEQSEKKRIEDLPVLLNYLASQESEEVKLLGEESLAALTTYGENNINTKLDDDF